MKFLILATCVCMAVAAPQQRFPVRNVQPFARATAVVTGPAVATQVVAQDVYNTAQVANTGRTAYTAAQGAYNNAAVRSYASGSEVAAETLRADADVRPDGFNYNYETSNAIKSEATGELKQIGETAAVVVRGQYSYTGPDGVPVVVTYVADENGYQPQSDSIPVAPPVPAAIARSLEYIRNNPEVIISAKRI